MHHHPEETAATEPAMRIDRGAQYLLKEYHDMPGRAMNLGEYRGAWDTVDKVTRFVGSCAAVAASSQSDVATAGSSHRVTSSHTHSNRDSTTDQEAESKTDIPSPKGTGRKKGKEAMKKSVRWDLPFMSPTSTDSFGHCEVTVSNASEVRTRFIPKPTLARRSRELKIHYPV